MEQRPQEIVTSEDGELPELPQPKTEAEALPTAYKVAAELLTHSSNDRLQVAGKEAQEQLRVQQGLPELALPHTVALEAAQEKKAGRKKESLELLQKHAEGAAEQNIALELQYEMRHEAKDVASTTADEVQTVLAGVGTDSGGDDVIISGTPHGTDIRSRLVNLLDQTNLSDLYKQAILAGLLGAGVVIIFGVIVFTLG